jgi:hypothetical protein
MGVGGHRHAPAAPPGKTRYPLYWRLGVPQARSGRVQKISPPIGIRSPDRPSRIESLYQLSYTGPPWNEDTFQFDVAIDVVLYLSRVETSDLLPFIRSTLQTCLWRQIHHVFGVHGLKASCSKSRELFALRHGITSQKTCIFSSSTAVRTSNFAISL